MNRKIAIISSLLFLSFPSLTLANPPHSLTQTVTSPTCNVEPENAENGEYSQQQLQNIANQITVRVIGDNNGGSGTMFAKRGNSYLVVTNSHVLLGVNKIQIKTPDGKTYSAQILPNTNFGNLDLTVLQFTSNQNYCLPPEIASFDINKDTEVLAAGYSSSKGEIAFRTGKVQRIISQPSLKEGYEIGYSSDIEQGMSGGAIIDSRGYLLGINGKSAYPVLNSGYVYADGKRPTDTEIQELRKLSWGIPIKTLLAQVKSDILTAYALPIPDEKQGILYNDQKKWELALADYNKTIAINPDFAQAYVNRGVLYNDQKKWELALADYNKAIAINPDFAQAYNNRGLLYNDQKKWELALADYNKAIAINPDFAQPYSNRGVLYVNLKKWELALADWNKAIAINPDFAQAYINRGLLYYQIGDKQKAIENLQRAAQLFLAQGDTASYEQIMNLLKGL